MPDITFPHTFTDTDATDPDAVAQNIYEPRSTPRTLEVINGRLSLTNLKLNDPAVTPLDNLTRNEVRAGSFVHATPSRGATANRDYFKDFWTGDWSISDEDECADRALAIVGVSKSFENEWLLAKGIYIAWHLSAVIDGRNSNIQFDGTGNAFFALFVNGVKVTGVNRRLSEGGHMMVQRSAADQPPPAGHGTNYNALAGYPDVRHWSGHWMVEASNVGSGPGQTPFTIDNTPLLKGFHNASIRIAHNNRHVRVRTSNMTVFVIR